MGEKWLRVRFYAMDGDSRPVKWPPPGPFWETGFVCSGDPEPAVVVAYLRNKKQLKEFWPDAAPDGDSEFDWQERDSITFTDRFQRPDWWKP